MNFSDEPTFFIRQLYLLTLVSLSLLFSNYFGQTVTSMSEELSEAAYGSLWYEQDMKFKKDFKAFLIYLNQEIVFEIRGIFRVDLEYFVIVRNLINLLEGPIMILISSISDLRHRLFFVCGFEELLRNIMDLRIWIVYYTRKSPANYHKSH